MDKQDFLEDCKSILGAEHVITDPDLMLSFVTDWRRRVVGRALAVVMPSTTSEVAHIVRLCNQYDVPLVPQGGNTGLVLGSIPDDTGRSIVLSMKRLNRIRHIDTVNNTMTVEAGCILDNIHSAATDADRLFPLSFASSGTAMIGGNLASNAGGTAVLRYGTARELCLGLEVVTAQGAIWNGLKSLRKDNTGYDLRDLFIGSEGTLGIITAAVLKLYPRPASRLTAFVAMDTPEDALRLLDIVQKHCGASLTAFELVSQYAMHLVTRHFPSLSPPLPPTYGQYALIEISDSKAEDQVVDTLETFLGLAIEEDIIKDAVIAQSLAQAKNMWQIRENISDAQGLEGRNIKHDIAIPVSSVHAFLKKTDALLEEAFPGCKIVAFGHLGDGSLHYNVGPPDGIPCSDFVTHAPEVNRIVYDTIQDFNGTISAEHGLGALKIHELERYKCATEIALMKTIKMALDPKNLMNPGKILMPEQAGCPQIPPVGSFFADSHSTG